MKKPAKNGAFYKELEKDQKDLFAFYAKRANLPEALLEPCRTFFNLGFKYGGALNPGK